MQRDDDGSLEVLGWVEAIWRYPVRSMRGEPLQRSELARHGLVGDRAWSVVDLEQFALAAAGSQPRRWARLLDFSARYAAPPSLDAELPGVCIEAADGSSVDTRDADAAVWLGERLGRGVSLRVHGGQGARSAAAEARRAAAAGSGASLPSVPYTSAPVHLVTTASLDALRRQDPGLAFDVARFRPNLLVRTPGPPRFLEADWVGSSLRIGKVELDCFEECKRCVVTTLAQPGLDAEPKVLRSVVEANRTFLGIYLSVVQPGEIAVGDPVLRIPRGTESLAG